MANVRWKRYGIALACLAAFLSAGCPNAGSLPVVSTAVVPQGSTASASATPGPVVSASGPPASAPASISSNGPAVQTGEALLKGNVYDQSGAAVVGATVRARSLSSAVAYDQTQQTVVGGHFSFVGVPAGVQVEIEASQVGWTTRRRVQVLLPKFENRYNFGGLADSQDPEGPAYFISNYPEISEVTPGPTAVVDSDKLSVTLKFSEPLDATNRFYAEKALAISAPHEVAASGTFSLTRSTGFMQNSLVSKVAWNAAGDEMSYTFDAPVLASKKVEKPYTIMLIRRAGDPAVRDASGHALGMIEPAAEASYTLAFREPVVVASNAASPNDRWLATHRGDSTFKVKKAEETRFKLVSATGYRLTYNNVPSVRFVLTFDRAMQVYAGPDLSFKPNLGGIGNYVFALSQTAMDQVAMTAAPATNGTSAEAANLLSSHAPFLFASGTIDFALDDPEAVTVTVADALVPTTAQFFKVKVSGIVDAANVSISSDSPDSSNLTADNIKIGTL